MFIRQRGNRWQGRVAIKGYPEQVKSFACEAEAYAWAADIEKQIKEGGYSEPNRTTLQGALKRYAVEVSAHKKGATQESSVIAIMTVHRMAALPLIKVKGADVAAYRDDMKAKGYAPATISRHLAVLSNVFNTARREWAIDVANPVAMVKKPTIRNARSRRVTSEELEKILACTESHELRTVVLLAVETAMRRSEIASLRWERIDLKRRIITLIETKNGCARDVPLSTRATEMLHAMPRRIDGRVVALRRDSMTQAFARACARASIMNLRLHDLRHEGVTRLFERGLGIMEVAAISGHKTLSQLQRYTHLNAEELARKLA